MSSNNGIFPDLVIDMGSSPTRTTGAVTASPLGQLVDSALREVLAWRPRSGDPKGFVAALNQAFTISEVEGHTEFAWTPRSYTVQADMGAVTGAQASIYARAKSALDQSVPLLEGLYPLRPDDDAENADAIRAVVINKFTELVNELGEVGGPRLPRIEDYFDSLLGESTQDDPEAVEGLFGQMRDTFGLERELVNTIDEEHDLTNYMIVVDHTIALRRSWHNLRHFFDQQSGDVFLGTQLVLLSRALGVVAESVQELYFVLDSVFLGAAERQTVRLNTGLTIAELFGWVEHFTTEEALRMIRDGGKNGVIAFRSTVRRLLSLVEAAWIESDPSKGNGNPQRGFHHPRTTAALEEVSRHMRRVVALTDQLKRGPALKVIFALENPADPVSPRVTIEGQNFQSNAEVYLNEWGPDKTQKIHGQSVYVVSSTEIKATFDLTKHADTEWAVVVKNPDGEAASMAEKFVVRKLPPPPPEPAHLTIKAISLLTGAGEIKQDLDLEKKSVIAGEDEHIAAISVTFDQQVNIQSVAAGKTFRVNRTTVARSMVPIDGQILSKVGATAVFQIDNGDDGDDDFPSGDYRVVLETGITGLKGETLAEQYSFSMQILPSDR